MQRWNPGLVRTRWQPAKGESLSSSVMWHEMTGAFLLHAGVQDCEPSQCALPRGTPLSPQQRSAATKGTCWHSIKYLADFADPLLLNKKHPETFLFKHQHVLLTYRGIREDVKRQVFSRKLFFQIQIDRLAFCQAGSGFVFTGVGS